MFLAQSNYGSEGIFFFFFFFPLNSLGPIAC
jgi:hypothetical protein